MSDDDDDELPPDDPKLCAKCNTTNNRQALFDKTAAKLGRRTTAAFTFALFVTVNVPLAIAFGSIWSAPALTAGILATGLLWRVLSVLLRTGTFLRRSKVARPPPPS